MPGRIRVEFDAPTTIMPGEALIAIGRAMGRGDETSGSVNDSYRDETDGEIRWTSRTVGGEVPVDPRQLKAAAALLLAFDAPVGLEAYASSVLAACDVNPGMSSGDVPNAGPRGRMAALWAARSLCDEMIAEINAKDTTP